MKKCPFCGNDIDINAAFCGYCGKPQAPVEAQAAVESPPVAPPVGGEEVMAATHPEYAPQQMPPPGYPAMEQGAQQQAPPPQYPPAGYYPPQQGVPGFAPPPKEPSKLALYAKGYLPWLTKGFLGTKEPMHILLAAIVPFLVAFFFTLGTASQMDWHAGAFFLTWLFNIVYIAVLPVAVWLIKKFWEKDESATPESVFAEYSSYHNIILPVVFVTMILGIAFPVYHFSAHFIAVMFQFVRLLSLGAAFACLFSPRDAVSKTWLKIIALIGVFVAMWFVVGACYTAGIRWGISRMFF